MFSEMGRCVLTVLLTVALIPLLSTEQAQAQCRGHQQRQNALLQTNASQQNALLTASQRQQRYWQNALQQTNVLLTALQQQQNPSPDQITLLNALLQQQNALQTALQQTQALQTALLQRNGQATPSQLQTLRQQQIALGLPLRPFGRR